MPKKRLLHFLLNVRNFCANVTLIRGERDHSWIGGSVRGYLSYLKDGGTGMKSAKSFLCSVFSLLIALVVLAPSSSSAEPLDNWHWRNPLPQGSALYDVNLCNGTFIAVGYFGTIFTSSDGISWTLRSSGTKKTLYGVAYGNGIFVPSEIQGPSSHQRMGCPGRPRHRGRAGLFPA